MKISHTDQPHSLQIKWSDKNTFWNAEITDGTEGENVPRSRFLHACCLLGQNLYLFGGKDGYTPLKDFWKLNIGSGEWTKIETTESGLPHLQGHTMVPYKSQIFIFGGTFYETVEETSLWIYNPDLNLMKMYSCEEHLPRPMSRREHSAVTHNNVMYVFGGFMDNSGSSEEFWAFDMEAEQWKAITNTKPGPHHGHVAVTYSGCMWIHGGMRNLTYLSDLWMYSFALHTWKKVKGLGTCPALTGHTANAIYDNIIMVGGCRNRKPSSDAWIFNFRHNTWRCVETPKQAPFPSISLHKSVLIDPVKMSQADVQASTRSVPNLKTPAPLLPWQQSPPDIRPWTSHAPGFHDDSQRESVLDLQLTMLLDKNNNSEDDITRLSMEDSCSSKGDFYSPLKKIDSEEQTGEKLWCQTGNQHIQAIPRLKADVLKIRPASYEDCGDESPLLGRFHSIESDVDLGQSNKIITLSDENVCIESGEEDHQVEHLLCNHDNPSRSTLYEIRDSHSGKDMLEFSPEETNISCLDHHSAFLKSSTTSHNSAVSFDACSNRLLTEDKEKFFTNPLYETLYGESFKEMASVDLKEGNILAKTTNIVPQSKDIDKHQSSDLILEDLESCEDDLILRNIKLPYPSNQLTHWSSLKDLTSSCYHFNDSDICQQSHTKSLDDLKTIVDSEAPKYQKKLEYLKHDAYGRQNKKYSRFHSIEEVRRQSRKSQRISRTYVKHSAMTGHRKSVPDTAQEEEDGLMSAERQDCHQHSQSLQTPLSKLRNKLPVNNSRDSYYTRLNIQPRTDANIRNVQCRDAGKNSSPWKIPYGVTNDQRLVLMILGGQTEADICDTKSLKLWNCYLF